MNERVLSAYLKRLGFSPAMKGYSAVYLAIILVLERPHLINSITERLYCLLAKELVVSPCCIERRIRTAIERAWLNGDMDFIEEVFQYSIDGSKGKPTNRQFIATMAELMRLEMIFGDGFMSGKRS